MHILKIQQYFEKTNVDEMIENIDKFKKLSSWSNLAKEIITF